MLTKNNLRKIADKQRNVEIFFAFSLFRKWR